MNHKLHGNWRSFVFGEDENGDLFTAPDGEICLKMTKPDDGTVEQGSTHIDKQITGSATMVNGQLFLDLEQEHLKRHYEGFLVSEHDIGAEKVLIITGRVSNGGVDGQLTTADKAASKGTRRSGSSLTEGQEEGTWMATKP
jgi:hypothetical protein